MKIFVTYSTPKDCKARNVAGKMARWFGRFDKVVLYSPDDIDDDFRQKHDDILNIKKGAGLWLWKPYSIYKALVEEANEGDYVFYCDAASFFIRKCDYIINTMDDSDVWVSDNVFIEEQCTKEDVFHLLECTDERYRKSNQIQAQFICIRKSAKSLAFVKKWLDISSDLNFMGPDNIKLGLTNCEEFKYHRYDQSLLSLLVKKNNIKPHINPLLIGYPNKFAPIFYRNGNPVMHPEYPCCLVLHHSANIDFKKSIVTIINAWMPNHMRLLLLYIRNLYKLCRNKKSKSL